MLWVYEVAIFESESYPVVVHQFYGQTKDEAYGYFQSHMKTDSFMRECVTRGRWRRLQCQAADRWYRV